MAAIELRGIRKAFGATRVLHDVSLGVRDGEFLTLLGPSGCGKSTLLRIIAGLEAQDAGSVAIGGVAVDRLPPKRRDVAMVFQSYALYPHMTVARNIGLPLRMRELSAWQRLPLVGPFLPGARATERRIGEEVGAVARALEIEALLGRKPGQLSGGQRQRVALGRAMVRSPAVFLMDEPLSNLDAKLRVQTRAEIAELHRRLGTTFVYVTHDQAEAMTMSDRVAVMLDGALLQVGGPRDVYADPADLRVASFIGSPRINLLPARAEADGTLHLPGGAPVGIAAPAGMATIGAVTIGLRPEALFPAGGDAPLTGRVRLVEHLGADAYVHLAVEGVPEAVVLRMAPDRATGLALGALLGIGIAWERALLFDAAGARLPLRVRADA